MMSILVAYANQRVIGYQGGMPWHLPNDLRRVKQLTTGQTIVMGRKTFDSLRRPLPHRRNVVLTTDPAFHAEGVQVVHSVDEVIELHQSLLREAKTAHLDGAHDDTEPNVFIFGGAAVYERFLPLVDRLYITEIDASVEGDTWFPAWNRNLFSLISQEEGVVDEKNQISHRFLVYQRK